jgi:hypothetical protein
MRHTLKNKEEDGRRTETEDKKPGSEEAHVSSQNS